MHDTAIYANPSRLSIVANGQFHSLGQDHFRLHSCNQTAAKPEDYPSPTNGDSLPNLATSHFLGLSESNPLFSQDRMILGSYSQPSAGHSSSLGFTSVNRGRDHGFESHHDQEQRQSGNNIKLEPQLCDAIESHTPDDSKAASFSMNAIWGSQTVDSGAEMREGLDEGQLEI